MVANSRATICSDRLRPLNQPKPIRVQEDANGDPLAITLKGQRIAVEGIKDRWRIDDEWWRKLVSRLYCQVIMKDGRMLTLFHDLVDGGWFMQSDAMPESRPGNLRVFVGRSTQTRHSTSSTRDVRRTALP